MDSSTLLSLNQTPSLVQPPNQVTTSFAPSAPYLEQPGQEPVIADAQFSCGDAPPPYTESTALPSHDLRQAAEVHYMHVDIVYEYTIMYTWI